MIKSSFVHVQYCISSKYLRNLNRHFHVDVFMTRDFDATAKISFHKKERSQFVKQNPLH